MADLVTQFRELIGKAELTELRQRPDDAEPKARRKGTSLRQMIFDKAQEGQIGMFDAWELACECDARLNADGVKFGAKPATAADPEPVRQERVDLPHPFPLDEAALMWCAMARTQPRERLLPAETFGEQASRIHNYVDAKAIARREGRELEQRDERAIWFAVCGQTGLAAKRAEEAEVPHGG